MSFLWHNSVMGKKEKLYTRIRNNPKNVHFRDFCVLMEYFGFVSVRVRGSHHLYQHPQVEDVMNVQPTKDNLAKSYQVRQFLKLIDSHHLLLEDEPDEQ